LFHRVTERGRGRCKKEEERIVEYGNYSGKLSPPLSCYYLLVVGFFREIIQYSNGILAHSFCYFVISESKTERAETGKR
jgi:hypothetical protein